jgi:hypothetical protein
MFRNFWDSGRWCFVISNPEHLNRIGKCFEYFENVNWPGPLEQHLPT